MDPGKKLVVVRFTRKVTVEDIARYANMLRANPEFRPDFSEIADMTDVEEIEMQGEDFLKLADQIDPFSIEAKRAFVARSSVQRHAARMHKLLRSDRNIEIFPTFEDAEGWIEK